MKIRKNTKEYYEKYIEDDEFFSLYRGLKTNNKKGLKILLERSLWDTCTDNDKRKTYKQLGVDLSITTERVRQIESKILELIQRNYIK
jgi:DNA-directed RNA polymerase sigma subunit (sigma70/sigma32)